MHATSITRFGIAGALFSSAALFGIGAVLAPAASGFPAVLQEDAGESEDPEGDCAQLLEDLAEFYKRKDDASAIAVIEKLQKLFPQIEKKELHKKVVKGVEKGLSRRRKEDDNALFVSVVTSYRFFAAPGKTAAMKSLKHKNVDDRDEVLGAALESLGSFQDPARIKILTGYLQHKEPLVVASAVKALGLYAPAPEKYRKQIVADLVRTYSTVYMNSLMPSNVNRQAGSPSPNRPRDRDRYDQTAGSFEEALTKLTKHKTNGSPQWMRWWNKNRRKKWPTGKTG